MKLIPNGVSRLASRQILKLSGASPTILVVAGVVGLGATAVLAAKASRNLDPVLDRHQKDRIQLESLNLTGRDEQKELVRLYSRTTLDLGKLYGPTLLVGTTSAVAVLGGHKILRGRHLATVAAYSGLMDQFRAYRGRVAQTLGEDAERGIYEGAHGEWQEDPDHKGEYKLKPVFDPEKAKSVLRPWFDETNANFTRDAEYNYMFLKGAQNHQNNMLAARGHVFLNDVLDGLGMPRVPEGQQVGWVRGGDGDNFIDFGFMSSINPHTIAFQNGLEKTVQLNFNVDGVIWDLIKPGGRHNI